MPVPDSSLAHAHFPPGAAHGPYRFCRHCWSGRELPTILEQWKNPGRELPGCIKKQPHSAGSLLKHCRTHGLLVKQEPLGKDSHCDESVTADRVHTHILELQQLRGQVIRSSLGNTCLTRALGLALSYGALSRTRFWSAMMS